MRLWVHGHCVTLTGEAAICVVAHDKCYRNTASLSLRRWPDWYVRATRLTVLGPGAKCTIPYRVGILRLYLWSNTSRDAVVP